MHFQQWLSGKKENLSFFEGFIITIRKIHWLNVAELPAHNEINQEVSEGSMKPQIHTL